MLPPFLCPATTLTILLLELLLILILFRPLSSEPFEDCPGFRYRQLCSFQGSWRSQLSISLLHLLAPHHIISCSIILGAKPSVDVDCYPIMSQSVPLKPSDIRSSRHSSWFGCVFERLAYFLDLVANPTSFLLNGGVIILKYLIIVPSSDPPNHDGEGNISFLKLLLSSDPLWLTLPLSQWDRRKAFGVWHLHRSNLYSIRTFSQNVVRVFNCIYLHVETLHIFRNSLLV